MRISNMPMLHRFLLTSRRSRIVLGFAVIACLSLRCDRYVGPQVIASGAVASQTPASPPAQPRSSMTLAFDLSPESSTQASGSPAVVGFQIGYFRPGPLRTPLKTVDLGRDAVIIEGNAARVTFVPESLPAGDNEVVLRLRSKSLEQFSDWSEPTAIIKVPGLPPRGRRRVPSGADATGSGPTGERAREDGKSPRKGRLVVADLEKHAALQKALEPMLTGGLSIEAAVGPFRRIDELATAVALTRQHKLSFAEVCKRLEGPPPQSLRNVLRALKPSVNSRQALRDARNQGRTLVTKPKSIQ